MTPELSFSAYAREMRACLNQVSPTNLFDPSLCEAVAQVGVFFDGTNNNRAVDAPKMAHSNVARLADAFEDARPKGMFQVYVPGVGTSFPKVGEHGESSLGGGFAVGCESRVLYAILEVFNCIHHRVFPREPLLSPDQVKALCSHDIFLSPSDVEVLARLGFSKNLLSPEARDEILKRQLARLAAKLKVGKKPKLKECLVDVFGFSRGAAEARVFCNWLDKLLVSGEFAGVPLKIRFLGLFDTVASAGFWNGIASTVTNSTDGHSGWAAPESLLVPSSVENCVHFLAMHELRKNFPLDEIGVDGILPKGHVQVAYPGSHSDVGGGYAPSELGISVGRTVGESDALKLSQVPLSHMFECAVAAGVPLSKDVALGHRKDYDPFALAPATLQAFNDFLRESGQKKRPLRDWMQPYLNWRWQVRNQYVSTQHFTRANVDDKKLLLQANRQLISDANLLMGKGVPAIASQKPMSVFNKVLLNKVNGRTGLDAASLGYMDSEAGMVLAEARSAPPISKSIAAFFDNYVHDSFAGFTKVLTESTGYWRYRKAFKGSERVCLASNDMPDDDIA